MSESELRSLYERLRTETRERWDRDLPFTELLFDRWERARSLGFGEGASIYHSAYVYGEVRVGTGTWIGPYVVLEGVGGIEIGSWCSISAGVHVYTHDSVRWALSGGEAEYERAAVHIGDCTYIGSQSVVAKGVTVGDHCVVGACSFVNADVDPYTIVGGVPARPLGHVRLEGGRIELVMHTAQPPTP